MLLQLSKMGKNQYANLRVDGKNSSTRLADFDYVDNIDSHEAVFSGKLKSKIINISDALETALPAANGSMYLDKGRLCSGTISISTSKSLDLFAIPLARHQTLDTWFFIINSLEVLFYLMYAQH